MLSGWLIFRVMAFNVCLQCRNVSHFFVLCSFIQLDLGQLQVSNEFSWHGSEKDPSAVHIDVLHAEVDLLFNVLGVVNKITEYILLCYQIADFGYQHVCRN